MKRLRLYLETSVWNFIFANDSPEKMEKTVKFFEEIKRDKYEIYISELVIAEIDETEEDKKIKLKNLYRRVSAI